MVSFSYLILSLNKILYIYYPVFALSGLGGRKRRVESEKGEMVKKCFGNTDLYDLRKVCQARCSNKIALRVPKILKLVATTTSNLTSVSSWQLPQHVAKTSCVSRHPYLQWRTKNPNKRYINTFAKGRLSFVWLSSEYCLNAMFGIRVTQSAFK